VVANPRNQKVEVKKKTFVMPNQKANYTDKSTRQQWVKTEGIPSFSSKIQKVELVPWNRRGGLGVYLNLFGTGKLTMPISMKSILVKRGTARL